MDYLFTDVYRDRQWLGITCRSCGARPAFPCRAIGARAKGNNPVPVHMARRHDLIMGQVCECGKCDRGHRKKKGLDTPPQT